MSDSDNFTLWYKADASTPARKLVGSWLEPAHGADRAEKQLLSIGTPGASWCELRLNGDPEPHTCIFFLENETFGIWNTEIAQWPIFYTDGMGDGQMLESNPFSEVEDPESDEILDEEDDEDGFGDEDEDSEIMDLGGEDESEDEDSEEDEDEIDEEDGGEDEDSEDSESDEELAEADDDDEDDDPEPELKEDEMPRVNLFAKFKGPLGWRKKAVSEELNEVNHFSMFICKDDGSGAKDDEMPKLVSITFVEGIVSKEFGLLSISLPEGTEMFWDENSEAWLAKVHYAD